ncbi:MAG: molecular chaperone DnaJ [Gaiella sp.]
MATAERDYYEVLGVARSASEDEIKRAFRRLARELHPDVSTEPDAHERFKEVAEAYEVLSDRERRATYDRFGHAGLRGGGFRPTEFDFGDLGDVFTAFFGEGLFGAPTRGGRVRRGGDVAVAIELTLAEALTGKHVTIPVRVARTCATCAGDGAEPGSSVVTCAQCAGTGRVQQVAQSFFGQVVRSGTCPRCAGTGRVVETPCTTCDGAGQVLVEEELEVDVPAGIHDGQRIRVRGRGHAAPGGGQAGDAYVQVEVAGIDGVERDGDDLHVLAELTMTQATLGSTVEVATPEGSLPVELPAGTQPGSVHRIRGRGMPSLETGRRGDLLVHVDVRIPTRLDPEQRLAVLGLEEALGEDPYAHRPEHEGFFARLKSAFR